MVDIYAHFGGSLAIGRRGENEARQVVFDLSAWRRHYGDGTVQLLHQRAGDESPYPCALTVEGDTAYWLIRAADVDKPGWGEAQLHYYVGDTLAKSAIWRTVTADALGDPSEPPEDPARAWFAAIRKQIGNLDELTTEAKDNLVAAINEAAKSGGGAGSISMRVSGGYIQYSTNGGTSWDNLIATADLQGAKGDPGTDGKDGTPGKDGTDGITPHIGDNGNWYLDDTDTGKPSRGKTGPQGPAGPAGTDGKDGAGMDITGATVGQIAKITAVDASGKPTAWEPVDMPSGGAKPYKILYNQTLSEAAVVKVDADADAAACNEYVLSMAIPKGDVAVAYNRYTTILCVADCVNNIRVVDASFGTLHQARMLKSDDGGAWIDFFSSQTTTATPTFDVVPRTSWANAVRYKVTNLTTTLFDSKVELPAGTIIIIGGR